MGNKEATLSLLIDNNVSWNGLNAACDLAEVPGSRPSGLSTEQMTVYETHGLQPCKDGDCKLQAVQTGVWLGLDKGGASAPLFLRESRVFKS